MLKARVGALAESPAGVEEAAGHHEAGVRLVPEERLARGPVSPVPPLQPGSLGGLGRPALPGTGIDGGARPSLHAARALEVVEARSAALGLLEDVVALPADDAHADGAAGRTGGGDPVVPVVEVEADLLGLRRVEAALEVGRRVLSEGDAHGDRAAALAPDIGAVVAIGRVDVDATRQPLVEPHGAVPEAVPPALQRLGQGGAAQGEPLRRQLLHGRRDGGVVESAGHLLRRLREVRPAQPRQHPAIDLGALEAESLQVLDPGGELHELRVRRARRAQQQALELREGLVAVLGEGLETVLAGDPHPAPLLVVAIPVLEDQVEHPARTTARVSTRVPAP